jgi:hypothetical protein
MRERKRKPAAPLDMSGAVHVFDLAGRKLFDAAYLEEGNTAAQKIETITKLRKANTVPAREYSKKKAEPDKQGFKTAAEARAEEHSEMIPDSERRATGGEPPPARPTPKPRNRLTFKGA